jgi:hypothetical protein
MPRSATSEIPHIEWQRASGRMSNLIAPSPMAPSDTILGAAPKVGCDVTDCLGGRISGTSHAKPGSLADVSGMEILGAGPIGAMLGLADKTACTDAHLETRAYQVLIA